MEDIDQRDSLHLSQLDRTAPADTLEPLAERRTRELVLDQMQDVLADGRPPGAGPSPERVTRAAWDLP